MEEKANTETQHEIWCKFNEEKWKDIEGYEGIYKVSTYGNVYSIKLDKIMKPGLMDGYYRVSLNKNKKRKTLLVSRLVAKTFISNQENKPMVDHINRITTNNFLYNLRWATAKENANNTCVKIVRSHTTTIQKLNLNYEVVEEKSVKEIMEEFKCQSKPIINAYKSFPKHWKGFYWRKKEDTITNINNMQMLHYYLSLFPEKKLGDQDITLYLINGYNNYYITRFGDIWNNNTKRWLRPCLDDKYWVITLYGEKKSYCQLHRLVAQTFILKPLDKEFVNHKDGNKSNPYYENLEWVTASENAQHAHDNNLINVKTSVCKFNLNKEFIAVYESMEDAIKSVGLKSSGNISDVCIGKKQTAGKHVWKYTRDCIKNEDGTYNYPFVEGEIKSCSHKGPSPTCQFNLDGSFKAIHKTAKEGADTVSLTRNCISVVCRDKKGTSAGYIWRYERDCFKLLDGTYSLTSYTNNRPILKNQPILNIEPVFNIQPVFNIELTKEQLQSILNIKPILNIQPVFNIIAKDDEKVNLSTSNIEPVFNIMS
jgi:hypothetical protein